MPTIDVAGTTLHFLDRGEGPVALFVHGFPLDSTMWLDQIERLSDLRRCVAVDLRGFGRSSAVTDEVLTMERHGEDLVALLGALGIESADVVALSMGGYVALYLAQVYPELIRTLALVDTRAAADTSEGRAGRDEAVRRVLGEGRRSFAEGMLMVLVAPNASVTTRARMRSMMEGTRYETMVAALRGMRDRPDRTAILARIGVPTSVVVGELDAVTPPADACTMADVLPDATVTVIEGAGHMTPLEAPDRVATALRRLWARSEPAGIPVSTDA
ncbi:MAG TPA: alpha/beta fold hydrolase [Acidimicrobiia bacterium]|jgi:pimeloyl-ACP methyl ester carboxylesterase|nr:alpha/beta fold hydrolase [Acidimicrobiia bacterium]